MAEGIQWLKRHPRWLGGTILVGILLMGGLGYLLNLGSIGLVDETEPLFAEAARQMWLTGDWITPYFNGETRFDKPPLIYWCMALSYHLLGANEWAVRLPSALSALALMGICVYVVHRWGLESLGLPPEQQDWLQKLRGVRWIPTGLVGALLGVTPLLVVWGRIGVSDMVLTACIGSALLAFFCGYVQPEYPARQGRWYLAFYVLLSLGTLTKGPVAIVLPALTLIAFFLYLGRPGWAILREMRFLRGSVVFLILTLPWFVAVIGIHGMDYVSVFFGYHNIQRFTQVVNQHSAPWYFYALVVAVGGLPYSVYLPMAIAGLQPWHHRRWRSQPRQSHLGLLVICWVLSIFLFFSIAVTKLPSYVLPLMPAVAILVGLLWSRQILAPARDQPALGLQISAWFNVGFMVVLAVLCWQLPQLLGPDSAAPRLQEAIQQAGLPALGVGLWGTAAAFGVVALLVQRLEWMWSVNLGAGIGLLLIVLLRAQFVLDAERQMPLRQLAQQLPQLVQPQEPILMIGQRKPSVVFYADRPIQFLPDPAQVPSLLSQDDAPVSALVLGLVDELSMLGDAIQRPSQLSPILEQKPIASEGPYQIHRIKIAESSIDFSDR